MRTYNRKSTKEKRLSLRQNMTETEKLMWEKLRSRRFLNFKFARQKGIGEYIADFYCSAKKVVVEIDGFQHYLDDGLEYDMERDKYLNSLGIKIIRFKNEEVLNDINDVLERLKLFMKIN